MVVHFPIALLAFGFCVDLAGLAMRRPWHRIGYALLLAGTAAAMAAVITGNLAAAGLRGSEHAAAIQQHEDYATLALLLYLALALGRLPGFVRGDAGLAPAWLVAGAVALGLLWVAALQGGALVYERGIGTRRLQPSRSSTWQRPWSPTTTVSARPTNRPFPTTPGISSIRRSVSAGSAMPSGKWQSRM